MQYSTNDAVISLSGSNPMHKKAMEHVKSLGTVVYLDVEDGDILNRLAEMKVNRIVGQNEGDYSDLQICLPLEFLGDTVQFNIQNIAGRK